MYHLQHATQIKAVKHCTKSWIVKATRQDAHKSAPVNKMPFAPTKCSAVLSTVTRWSGLGIRPMRPMLPKSMHTIGCPCRHSAKLGWGRRRGARWACSCCFLSPSCRPHHCPCDHCQASVVQNGPGKSLHLLLPGLLLQISWKMIICWVNWCNLMVTMRACIESTVSMHVHVLLQAACSIMATSSSTGYASR